MIARKPDVDGLVHWSDVESDGRVGVTKFDLYCLSCVLRLNRLCLIYLKLKILEHAICQLK